MNEHNNNLADDHLSTNKVMIALGFKWDVDRQTWYNNENVWMYQKAAVVFVERVNQYALNKQLSNEDRLLSDEELEKWWLKILT